MQATGKTIAFTSYCMYLSSDGSEEQAQLFHGCGVSIISMSNSRSSIFVSCVSEFFWLYAFPKIHLVVCNGWRCCKERI